MSVKRVLEGDGGGGGGGGASGPGASPALKKRCRSFDLEIRGCRHLEEVASGLAERVEAAIGRIPELLTNTVADFFNSSSAPSLWRTRVDQNRAPRYKLRFMNGLSNEVFTKKGICAENGAPLKICVEDNKEMNSSHHLLSAKIKFVVLDGDFNSDNKECWTPEDFSRHIVLPRDKVGAVLTGQLELRLKNGKADLHGATFIDNSKFVRSGKFRLGVMVVDEFGERVQEGITEPFTVKDRRGEGNKKHAIPSLDDDVYRLKKISKNGVLHRALKNESIFSVKDFLRFYNKDKDTLREILAKATKLVWNTIVDNAKMCDCGKDLYSFVVEDNVIMFMNSVYEIVGATSGVNYTPFNHLDKHMQDLLRQWSTVAYQNLPCRQPDYEMDNDKPRQITNGIFKGPSMLEPKVVQYHIEQQNLAERNLNETDEQQGTLGSHSKQCTLKRLGSIRVIQNDDDASMDISVFLDPEYQQYYPIAAANEITGSVTLNCPITAASETTGSGLLKQASFTRGHEVYDIPLANNDASVPRFDASLYEANSAGPIYSRQNSFIESNCHGMVAPASGPAVL